MRGNILLAVITLMVAMLMLAPAILGGGERRANRKKGAAAAAGPSGVAHTVTPPRSHLRVRGLRQHQVSRPRNNGPGLR